MLKKTSFFLVIFFVLQFFIILSIIRYSVHLKKRQVQQSLFSEIETTTLSRQFSQSSAPLVLGEFSAEYETGDARIVNLKQFFRKYNSDLFDHAEYIVKTSDKYQFDYRLLPAIAMQESNLCKYIPENSFNCWGWGIYGTTITRFDSYEDAIETVAKGLKKNYIDEGLVTATAIMEKYTPSSNGSWAHGVNTFLKLLQ